MIRVAELGRARRFYEVLGLELHPEQHGAGPEHLCSVVDEFTFELYPRSNADGPTTAVRLGFSLPAFAPDLLANLRAAGGEVLAAPEDSPWGRRALVRDPDGHTVELLEVLHDQGPRPA